MARDLDDWGENLELQTGGDIRLVDAVGVARNGFDRINCLADSDHVRFHAVLIVVNGGRLEEEPPQKLGVTHDDGVPVAFHDDLVRDWIGPRTD